MSRDRSISNVHPSECRLKIVLIGSSGVGKSTFLCRYCDDQFNPHILVTIGIDFKCKTINIGGRSVKLRIWDTAGQENFHSVTPSFCRRADGIILMYDITNLQSFKSTNYWLEKVREHSPDYARIMLIGSKLDLAVKAVKREVSFEMGKEAARRIDAPFFEISSASGKNIDEAFKVFTRGILEGHNLPHISEPESFTLTPPNVGENADQRGNICCSKIQS